MTDTERLEYEVKRFKSSMKSEDAEAAMIALTEVQMLSRRLMTVVSARVIVDRLKKGKV